MDDFTIEITCKGYNFYIIIDKKNITRKKTNLLSLNLPYEEFMYIINKIDDLKSVMSYNSKK